MAMVKIFLKLKKNNKGVSLVEVLVTLAVVVIMAGPLINGFLNAMGVNSNARTIQNGTTVGQDLVEEFEALPVEQLCGIYEEYLPEDFLATYEEGDILTFTGIPVDGPNGEKFEVDITLDPTAYNADGDKINVNNVELPGMSSLYASNSIMLYKDYVDADDDLKNLFAATGELDNDILENLNTNAQRQKMSKATNITVKCTYNDVSDKYDYDIEMEMSYSYKKSATDVVTVTEERLVEDMIFDGDQTHTIYLVCPVFDIYTWASVGGVSYATDSINIEYVYHGMPEDKKDVYFYLAEQEVNNKTHPNIRQRINPTNVKVKELETVYSITDASKKFDRESTIMLNTNIGKDTADLTYVNQVSGIALYDMDVQVRLAGDSKVIAEFTSSK
ncbi:MAG: prepilin-type N-terminal cleavage/methylation domain-containing protein [Lachnospiraceae bacterium]|nr:prepilin-type N-terminal cleavage/methylation domain-containing protein [Lachnospiraceae bacterium]MEE0686153.1 prepilin-type N-terminal cleavage/methylation domain-containing protein [Lachnospiraceae bacterium]MEE0863494.1 prepilin-type N-terminal cleavage/methylation domain-containing protein [Lachnospiraceae bacterium]